MGPSDNIKVVFGLKVIGEKKAVETEIEIFFLLFESHKRQLFNYLGLLKNYIINHSSS